MVNLLKRSPHFGQHVAHGAKTFFDFAGWEMPTHFSSLEDEVEACRTRAILFDGHAMGELHVQGPDALKAVQRVCANDLSKAKPGQCAYTSLCTPDGGILDDLVIFCLSEDHYLLTVAAANVGKTPGWVEKHTRDLNVCVSNQSAGTTCIEIQGPLSRKILAKVAEFDVSNDRLPYYRFVHGRIAGIDCLVGRLGVTGELGYEIFYDPGYAWTMYDALFEAGRSEGLALCGNRTIGMLRLEKVYHIYAREIDETTNPYEAGLGRTVKLDKGDFIGRDALARIKQNGTARKLIGFDAGPRPVAIPPRATITAVGAEVGKVTAAAFSPTLRRTIGLGYVKPSLAQLGTELTIASESGNITANAVEIPFVDPKGERLRG